MFHDRRSRLRELLVDLTDADLERPRTAVIAPVWGEETHTGGECLRVLMEEYSPTADTPNATSPASRPAESSPIQHSRRMGRYRGGAQVPEHWLLARSVGACCSPRNWP